MKIIDMKKISLLLATLVGIFAFYGCDESKDDHPVLTLNSEVVTSDFLNVPDMTNTAISLTSQNYFGKLHLTCSQPDYGFAAPVKYEVEVSLSSDFTTPASNGMPASVVLPTVYYDCAKIDLVNSEVARAINNMLNIRAVEQVPTPSRPLYVRLIANIQTVTNQLFPNTTYLSNTVSFKNVSLAYVVPEEEGTPMGFYIVGSMNNNAETEDWEFLANGEVGQMVLTGIEIPKGGTFIIKGTDPAPVTLGLNPNANLEFGKEYELVQSDSAQDITMAEDFSGNVTITFVGGKYYILFTPMVAQKPGDPSGYFIRGGLNDWGALPEYEFLCTDSKNVWRIDNITMPAGEFKVADANWSAVNYGTNGSNIEPGKAYEMVYNGNNIYLGSEFTGAAVLSLKNKVWTLTLEPK